MTRRSWLTPRPDTSPWLAAIMHAIGAVASQDPDQRTELLGVAATGFRRLGAPVLEAWLRSFQAVAMARTDDPETEQVALGADALARTTGVAAARGLAQLALATARGEAELARSATGVLASAGLLPLVATVGIPAHDGRAAAITTRVVHGVRARCFGRLELDIDGQPVDLGAARPRVRSLLRMLLSEPGGPFHHEVIAEAFWPEAAPDVGARNLHAAVAALRRLIEPGAARGGFRLIVREGSAYRFAVPPGSSIDVLEFDEAIATARSTRASGDLGATESALRTALGCHRGDLLADEGPATWLETPRERRRSQAVEAAATLASLCLERGDPEAAAEVCARGPAHRPLPRPVVAAAHHHPGASRGCWCRPACPAGLRARAHGAGRDGRVLAELLELEVADGDGRLLRAPGVRAPAAGVARRRAGRSGCSGTRGYRRGRA